MPGKDNTSPEAIEKRERQARALKMRRAGALYRQIADQLGVSPSTAYQYVADAMREITREPAEQVLNLERDRLEELRMMVLGQVQGGKNLKAVDRLLRIHAATDRLYDLARIASEQSKGSTRDMSAVRAFHAAILGEKATDDEVES